MNKLVRDHYPVEKLPEDLREGFASDTEVRVTVERTALVRGPLAPTAGREHLSDFRHHGRRNFASMAEIDAYVSALRSEWDDRDR